MTDRGFEHFDHVADIGVRGFGPTMADAFEQAALALTAVLVEPATVRPTTEVAIACSAPDAEILLVDWLNAVVYEMATRGLVFGAFDVHIDGGQLTAAARGEPVDAGRHAPAVEVKGATMTELSVHRDGHRWIAQCVVDV